MTFKNWLKTRELSDSTIKKYNYAITGSLSEWAIENGIISSPITTIENYNRFLSISEEIRNLSSFQEHDSRGNNMYNSALNWYEKYLSEGPQTSIENDIDEIFSDQQTSETEKNNLVKSRIGQGNFRKDLISYWGKCAVTGYSDIDLLLASHIKPWSVSSNKERLDPNNGLLLLPNIDKAFDSGLITFMPSGNIRISSSLKNPSLIGINTNMIIDLGKNHKKYLEYHNQKIYQN